VEQLSSFSGEKLSWKRTDKGEGNDGKLRAWESRKIILEEIS
jgi:hypothetical protein